MTKILIESIAKYPDCVVRGFKEADKKEHRDLIMLYQGRSMDCGMVREFSEEKKEEIFRILDEIDMKEWKPFMEWCGSSAEEFGDWPDRLNVSAYTRYVDEYQKKVLELNEMTRQQVNAVFENVAEIDARYAERMRECQEKIKEQIAMVRTMTGFMQSMTDGNPDMEVITKGSVNVSDSQKEGKKKDYKELNTHDQRPEEKPQLEVVVLDMDGGETQAASIINEAEAQGIISEDEAFFANQITDFIDGRSDYMTCKKCMDGLDSLYSRGLISEENYNCLKDIIDKVTHDDDMYYNIFDLRDQAREAYAEVESNIAERVEEKDAEKAIVEKYINEVVLRDVLGWDIDAAKKNLSENFIEDMKALMLEYGLTDERSIILFLMTSTHECSKGCTMTELYDDNWFANKSYTINTRGAGLIQVTGSNQKSFLQYVYDHSDDDNEKNILDQYIKGFENSDNPSKENPCDNKVIINGQNVCEYIASNYAIEASLWYWCNYTKKIIIDGDWITINECIEKYGSEKELDIIFLATQCAVAGSDFHEEGTGRLFIPENPVWIENNRINVTFCRNPEVNSQTEDHDSRLPKNWDQREDIYINSIDHFTDLLTANSLN